jgi:hypothetical protein
MNRAATGAAVDAASSGDEGFAQAEQPGLGLAAGAAAGAAAAGAGIAAAIGHGDGDGDDRADDGADARGPADALDPHGDDLVQRNPPRDWAAPPPWLASNEPRHVDDSEPPPFLGSRAAQPGQGLAGSAADRLAGGPPPVRHDESDSGVWSSDSRSAAAAGAGLAAGAGGVAGSTAGRRPPDDDGHDDRDDGGHDDRQAPRRPRAYAQHLGGPDGPDWEHPRRYEAYPTIKTRVGLPAVPRMVGLFGAVLVLALALFFLPGLLNLGGGTGTPAGSAGSSLGPLASSSVAPTEIPAATPIVYTIKKGDTLSKVAKAHGVTIEELRAANPAIKDPNKISEGQQIVIPAPSDAPPDTIDGSPAPS